jgi:RimJ/RimL family protein N-acetyltransferase
MQANGGIDIVRGDVQAFCALPAAQRDAADTRHYLQQLLDAQLTRPDWCLVARRDGQPVGRVALWGDAPLARPTDIVLLDLPWEQPHRDAGARLVEAAVADARAAGAQAIRHVLDEPPRRPQWQHHTPQRVAFLSELGFTVLRSTRRFEWGGSFRSQPPQRLGYRTERQLGLPALAQLVERVVTGSLDSIDRAQVPAKGVQAHAQWLLHVLQDMKHEPAWWQAGYLGDQPVGLVLPTAGPGFGTIGYMGVVPEHRGRGHVDELLVRGTATLLEAGLTRLVADTDVNNAPMAAAFGRVGWQEFGRRTEYSLAAA